MSLRIVTAGESHGPGLTCIVEGLPAGLELDREAVNLDMARRQLGHGRGGRMKIERDTAEITAGVRHGRTLGGPVALQVANRDYANWEERMSPWPVEADVPEVHLPRPGHADLAGVWKFGFSDVRNVLERASARETAARVAGGALAKAFLRALGVEVVSHVTQIGSVRAPERTDLGLEDFAAVDESPVRCLDADASARWSRRSTCCASATSRSAASSSCARSGSRPDSARTCPGRSAWTAASAWRCSRSRRSRASAWATGSTSPAGRARRPTTRSSTTPSAAITARRTAPAGSRAG